MKRADTTTGERVPCTGSKEYFASSEIIKVSMFSCQIQGNSCSKGILINTERR